MKIRANIEYPPPAFKARDLTFKEATKLVDALSKEVLLANRQLTKYETVLEKCQTYFQFHEHQELELQSEIEEVLK